MALRAVVFDLFHTLVDTEHLGPPGFHHTRATAELLGLEYETFRRWWDSTYSERETTPVDLVDVVQRYVTDRELTETERREIDGYLGLTRDDALRSPEPAMVELVGSVAARVRIGVLSNCYEREVRYWPESPLAPFVDAFVRSCDVGVMKPDAEMYRVVLDQIDVPAGEAIYVGNGAGDELVGAVEHGFARVVHCNIFDRSNGLVDEAEQRRRAAQADVSVGSIAELTAVLDRWLATHPADRG